MPTVVCCRIGHNTEVQVVQHSRPAIWLHKNSMLAGFLNIELVVVLQDAGPFNNLCLRMSTVRVGLLNMGNMGNMGNNLLGTSRLPTV
jgi:hypothetical protein